MTLVSFLQMFKEHPRWLSEDDRVLADWLLDRRTDRLERHSEGRAWLIIKDLYQRINPPLAGDLYAMLKGARLSREELDTYVVYLTVLAVKRGVLALPPGASDGLGEIPPSSPHMVQR